MSGYDDMEREARRTRTVRDHTRLWERLTPLADASGSVLERIDEFCASKGITRDALAALGTRTAARRGGSIWLAYAGRNGSNVTAIKYRPLSGSSHDSESEKPSVWLRPIVVGKLDSLDWLVAEGETEGARLFDLVGSDAAIMVLPAGALTFQREWADLIPRGAVVYLCLDADEDGDKGAVKAARMIGGRTVRVRPPDGAKDWCAWPGDRAAFVQLVHDARETLRFAGLSHRELLKTEPTPARQLIADQIEAGTLGTAAGLPETYKSFYALQATIRVGGGGGSVLGRKVLVQGPVGYWWQDDSRENELRRVQAYAQAHGFTNDLPIRWHLNEGLTRPDGIGALRDEVEREGQVLAVLDSLYNFLLGIKLKDEDVATVLATLKREVCDPTGCAILFVDHTPWPSESNQGQRRAYGSVFKTAAIRWGVYFDKTGDTIFVEAHGNNLVGMPRTPALWDAEALELRLIETPAQEGDVGDRIDEYLERNPGASTTAVVAGVRGAAASIIRKRLKSDERFETVPPVLFGLPRNSKCWARLEDVPDLLRERG